MPKNPTTEAQDAAQVLRRAVSLLRASGVSDATLIAALAHTTGETVAWYASNHERQAVALEAARQMLRAAVV